MASQSMDQTDSDSPPELIDSEDDDEPCPELTKTDPDSEMDPNLSPSETGSFQNSWNGVCQACMLAAQAFYIKPNSLPFAKVNILPQAKEPVSGRTPLPTIALLDSGASISLVAKKLLKNGFAIYLKVVHLRFGGIK